MEGDTTKQFEVGTDLASVDIAAKTGAAHHTLQFRQQVGTRDGSNLAVAHQVDNFGRSPPSD